MIAKNMPQEFALLFQYVNSLQYEDRPDYNSMVEMLETAKQRLRLNQSQFDWYFLATDINEHTRLMKNKTEVYK